jgi:hypothetical protein
MKKIMQLLILLIVPASFLAFACSENLVHIQEMETEREWITSGNHETTISSTAKNPVLITFDKVLAEEGVWEGTVTGEVVGDLRTELRDVRETGKIWHVEFDWIVTADDEAKSFTARLNGILNNNTGSVVMNGTVIDGWLKGARVHEEGQLTDPVELRFEGTIKINPATIVGF